MKTYLPFLFILCICLNWACKKDDDEIVMEEPPASGPIVVQNTGFEQNPGGWPDGWWFKDEPYDVSWTMDEAFSGSYSIAISSDTLIDDFNFWGQTINENIQPGKKLRLRVNVKLDSVIGEGVSIVIRGDNTIRPDGSAEYFATTQGDIDISGTHNWKEYRIEQEQPIPSTIRSITIYMVFLPNTTGTAYFDDVTLTYF